MRSRPVGRSRSGLFHMMFKLHEANAEEVRDAARA
jgi:hypothetical protein